MGKFIISEEEKRRILNLYEQRISDLPQNQQTGPTPNLGPAPKTNDLVPTLTPQQQQLYKDTQKGQPDLAKQYNSNKTDNHKIDDHTASTILSIATAFIPVVGPFISAGIQLYDAAKYYKEGDSKSAGMQVMFALLPGAGAVISKIPGVKELGTNGMKTLATKLSTKVPLTKLESEVAAGLSANQSLVRQELSKLTAQTAKKTAETATEQSVKQLLTNIGKKGLAYTGKEATTNVAGEVAYNKMYDLMNPVTNVN
jgi:hypothetical protein